ncbi:hypothetical protein M514_01568 [Trichuris suis]|uniref:Uncharacterized protein n=1 Tax=Trichuris suis TaxID=68888 RepID=A0A085MJR9_9BILA|nr:hypothetical protein M513_01568 [Trichuris suis]KFD66571.1 hypothetical protein M514_01568 [Trichuris suis]KHJ49121.1 hypothetical protein D918_00239 [Trichuris suis]
MILFKDPIVCMPISVSKRPSSVGQQAGFLKGTTDGDAANMFKAQVGEVIMLLDKKTEIWEKVRLETVNFRGQQSLLSPIDDPQSTSAAAGVMQQPSPSSPLPYSALEKSQISKLLDI